jgi:NAD dependent epimerase/dehydratase family enzyme
LVKTVAKVLDKPLFLPNIPRFAMKLVLGEMSTPLYDSQNVSARKIVASGYQFKFLSVETAVADALAE